MDPLPPHVQKFCDTLVALEAAFALREFGNATGVRRPPLEFHHPPRPGLDLSIVMPVWNADPARLRRALESVLAQAFGDLTYEIVVADDASTNGVAEKVLHAVAGPRIRRFRHAKNIGGMANFNWVIAEAQGAWIHMLHQDDWVEPGFYRGLLEYERGNADIGLRFCRTMLRDEFSGQTRLMHEEAPVVGLLPGFLSLQTVEQRVQFAGAIFSRAAVETVGGFDAEIGAAADWEFWARLASRYAVFYQPAPLATYVLHRDSWSSRGAANFGDARAFEKYRLLLHRMLTYVPPEARRATAMSFLRQMLLRVIAIGQRNRATGNMAGSRAVAGALFVGTKAAGLLPELEKALFA